MPSPAGDLLGELAASQRLEQRPWGSMLWLDAPGHDVTVKHLRVAAGERTSRQRHVYKDELLVIIGGGGFVEAGAETFRAGAVRIWPGTVHRVTGPLEYLEVSTYDDGADTVRLEDDYDR